MLASGICNKRTDARTHPELILYQTSHFIFRFHSLLTKDGPSKIHLGRFGNSVKLKNTRFGEDCKWFFQTLICYAKHKHLPRDR